MKSFLLKSILVLSILYLIPNNTLIAQFSPVSKNGPGGPGTGGSISVTQDVSPTVPFNSKPNALILALGLCYATFKLRVDVKGDNLSV